MSKENEKRLESLEDRAEGGSQPVRVHIRPDLTYEEGQALVGSLPTVDERGRPIVNVMIAGDDCNL